MRRAAASSSRGIAVSRTAHRAASSGTRRQAFGHVPIQRPRPPKPLELPLVRFVVGDDVPARLTDSVNHDDASRVAQLGLPWVAPHSRRPGNWSGRPRKCHRRRSPPARFPGRQSAHTATLCPSRARGSIARSAATQSSLANIRRRDGPPGRVSRSVPLSSLHPLIASLAPLPSGLTDDVPPIQVITTGLLLVICLHFRYSLSSADFSRVRGSARHAPWNFPPLQ